MANEKRLIDANELVEELYKSDAEVHSCYWMTSEIVDQIDRMPTVDAVEAVHGRWLYDSGSNRYFCSACDENALERKHTNLDGVEYVEECLTDYCPNCGAKMDGDGNG